MVPVRFRGGTFDEARADALADNEIQTLSANDEAALARVVAQLAGDGTDEAIRRVARSTAFSRDRIRDMIRSHTNRVNPSTVKPPRPSAKPTDPVSVRGEVYQLGPHRLMCGDCTDATHYAKLHQGQLPHVQLTDPPYCSGGHQEAGKGAGSIGRRADVMGGAEATIANDNLSTRGYQALMRAQLDLGVAAVTIIFTDWRMWIPLFDVVESKGLGVRAMSVWAKESPGMGRGHRQQHELAMVSVAAKHVWDNPKLSIGTVITDGDGDPDAWDYEMWGQDGAPVEAFPRTRNKHHFTEKPIGLYERLMRPQSDWAEVYYDPFGGSGPIILAAARQGVVARAMELDPAWCDVARDRWTRWAQEAGVDPGPGAYLIPTEEG